MQVQYYLGERCLFSLDSWLATLLVMVSQKEYHMIHYSDQPRTPSFPIGLVKTEYKSLDQMRLTLVVPDINVDVYPFLAFLDLTCHHEDTRIVDLWLHFAA